MKAGTAENSFRDLWERGAKKPDELEGDMGIGGEAGRY